LFNSAFWRNTQLSCVDGRKLMIAPIFGEKICLCQSDCIGFQSRNCPDFDFSDIPVNTSLRTHHKLSARWHLNTQLLDKRINNNWNGQRVFRSIHFSPRKTSLQLERFFFSFFLYLYFLLRAKQLLDNAIIFSNFSMLNKIRSLQENT